MEHPTGKFAAKVISAHVAESSKKGTPGVFFLFRTEHDDIEGSLWLSENAFEKTVARLREVFGFNGNFETIPQQIEGKECSITVEMETDAKGKEWPRVKWINAPKSATSRPVSGSLLAQLTARAKGQAAPAPVAAPAPATKDDEDIF